VPANPTSDPISSSHILMRAAATRSRAATATTGSNKQSVREAFTNVTAVVGNCRTERYHCRFAETPRRAARPVSGPSVGPCLPADSIEVVPRKTTPRSVPRPLMCRALRLLEQGTCRSVVRLQSHGFTEMLNGLVDDSELQLHGAKILPGFDIGRT
jgi:hypothetical protein